MLTVGPSVVYVLCLEQMLGYFFPELPRKLQNIEKQKLHIIKHGPLKGSRGLSIWVKMLDLG